MQLLHQYSFHKKLQSKRAIRKQLRKTLLNKKSCSSNIGEINTKGQFHQHIYMQLLHTQIPKTVKSSVSFCTFGIWTRKLVKLIPGFLKAKIWFSQKVFVTCVNILFPWVKMCQSRRRTHDNWKTKQTNTMCIRDFDNCKIHSVSRISITKARWLFSSHFWPSSIAFRGNWGSSVNWLETKIEPPCANLASSNPWNTLYV